MTISTDNEKEDISVSQFSADLLGNAEKHLVFLRALHQLGITAKFLDEASLEDSQSRYTNGMANSRFRGNDKAFVGESIRRYSRLWLPLVARAKKLEIDLIPPPDIAWMWHCHRLAPYRYSEHLRRENFTNNEPSNHSNNRRGAFSSMDPSHPFVFQLDTDTRLNFNDTWLRPDSENYPEIAKRTRALFEELYPTESFFGDSTPSASLHSDNTGAEPKLLSGFNVLDACQRQATFLWQVSGPSFSSKRFLMDGISNYLRFVKLTNHPKRSYSHMWLVPTYQIDLIWHTHILSSIEDYHNDVRRITGGTVLDHDDSINDRTEGGILDTNFQQTSQLWKEVYGLDYFTKGGMYNGEPPADYFWGMPRADRHATADATAADPDLTRNNYSTIAALNWMSPNHRLAFIPLERDWYNPYKEDYVFGVGGTFVLVIVWERRPIVFRGFSPKLLLSYLIRPGYGILPCGHPRGESCVGGSVSAKDRVQQGKHVGSCSSVYYGTSPACG